MDLLAERAYGSITVDQIATRADVGRSTFYSHYRSKEDLLFDGFDAWLLSLAEREPESDRGAGADARFRFSLPLLEHMGAHRRFARAALGTGAGSRVRRRTVELFTEVVTRELERLAPPTGGSRTGERHDEATRSARAHLVVGAFLGLAGWWLDAADPPPPCEVDRIFQSQARGVVFL